MRVKGGNNYIQFVDELLNVKRTAIRPYAPGNYELMVFDSLADLYKELGNKEQECGLSRLVAGYSWPYASKTDKAAVDIEIDGLKFQWNQTENDWINSPNAFKEIGCIHTTQGYDLNYVGVIFGKEISFDESTGKVVIDPKKYFDKNGKNGIKDPEELKAFIINIYKTIMYRGIRGSYIYACDAALRSYFKRHIHAFKSSKPPFRVLPLEDVKPYVNSVPLVDIKAAAGSFSDLQIHSHTEWIELPFNIAAKQGSFVCRIEGESMNKRIPNGSYCLFRPDEGGSREGKIVLVERLDQDDSDFGGAYTLKEYHSVKIAHEDGWRHKSIVLKPLSDDPLFEEIELGEDESQALKVVGVFECVL
jgi:DUF2075 family protein